MRSRLRSRVLVGSVLVLGLATAVSADEAPIAGIVKSVDTAAGTLVVESTSRGRVRQVTIYTRPESKVLRFVRSADAAKPGFTEQPATLADLKPGWTVSVKTRHEGAKEVAEIVRIVHER